MNDVRIGIIGIGGMGSNHAKMILSGQVPRLRLTAVADVSQSRLDWAKENLPEDIALFSDGRALIDSGQCDAVHIATPH